MNIRSFQGERQQETVGLYPKEKGGKKEKRKQSYPPISTLSIAYPLEP